MGISFQDIKEGLKNPLDKLTSVDDELRRLNKILERGMQPQVIQTVEGREIILPSPTLMDTKPYLFWPPRKLLHWLAGRGKIKHYPIYGAIIVPPSATTTPVFTTAGTRKDGQFIIDGFEFQAGPDALGADLFAGPVAAGIGKQDENSNNPETVAPPQVSRFFYNLSGPAIPWSVQSIYQKYEVTFETPLVYPAGVSLTLFGQTQHTQTVIIYFNISSYVVPKDIPTELIEYKMPLVTEL